MKIFKESCELRDEILMALYAKDFNRATAFMINISYAILILRQRGINLETVTEDSSRISLKILKSLRKLNLRTSDFIESVNIKTNYLDNDLILIEGLMQEDLNSYGREGKSILFSSFDSEDIADWLVSIYQEDISEGMDLLFHELSRNKNNEIFQYKLYMMNDSNLRNLFVGKNNQHLYLSSLKNEKSQTLFHLASIRKDYDVIADCLDYLNLDPTEEDDSGYSALDLLPENDKEVERILTKFGI